MCGVVSRVVALVVRVGDDCSWLVCKVWSRWFDVTFIYPLSLTIYLCVWQMVSERG